MRKYNGTNFSRLALGLALFCLIVSQAAGNGVQNDLGIQVIPEPVEIKRDAGYFIINIQTTLVGGPASVPQLEYFQRVLAKETGIVCRVRSDATTASHCIRLHHDRSLESIGNEGYRIEIDPDGVTLSARGNTGCFNGIQTLLQLLPIKRIVGLKDHLIEWRLPCCTITDYPRFSWRGLMIDCSRTFQSVAYLKKTIDRMAFYKLNVLHLHLTDDQGWRMEIKKHPELTSRGARFPDHWGEPESHHGYYTQDQLCELVAYAAARNITIVPEIEMPGHTLAVLSCFPELSCTGGPFEIHPFFKGPGIHEDIFCAGNDEVFRFLEEVLDEVIDIFPSKYIHIGGDEAPKARWEKCDLCQARIKAEDLKDEHELQSWFIRRIAAYVEAKGRTIIGWDEILEGGLAPGAAVMSWRSTRGGLAAAEAGHNVVMSPTSHCYFDYKYDAIDTARAYGFEPTQGMTEAQAACVLGLQANFWSHIDREPAAVDRQLFPRLLSMAELGWSPESTRDCANFLWRVRIHLAHLDEMGVAYDRSPLDRSQTSKPESKDETSPTAVTPKKDKNQ